MQSLRTLSRSPALRSFALLWLLAALFLVVRGEWLRVAVASAGHLLALALLAGTIRLTRGAPTAAPGATAAPSSGSGSGARAALQAALVLAVIAITAAAAAPFAVSVPAWSDVAAWSFQLGERTLPVEWVGGPGNALANPVQYVLMPLLLLLLLGASPRSLGFGRGHGAWRAAALWLALPAALLAVLLALGSVTPVYAVRRFLSNLLQNGFAEEFLFRGALQSRLGLLLAADWALMVQALLFGLWHLGANLTMVGGDPAAAIAACIVSQAMTGLIYGLLLQRTGNLLAPTCAHVGMNAFSQIISL